MDFHFLEQKEFGYFSDTKNTNVLEPPKQFISHSIISNCIIDFDNHSKHNMTYLKNELDLLGCEALQLRFFSEISFLSHSPSITIWSRTHLSHSHPRSSTAFCSVV